jgi:hypothetical protein
MHLTAREEHSGFEQLRTLMQQDQIERRRESEERRSFEREVVSALQQLKVALPTPVHLLVSASHPLILSLKVAYTESVKKNTAQNSSMASNLLGMRTIFETKQFKSPAPSPKYACSRPLCTICLIAQSLSDCPVSL